jgi:hypothetical protein
MERYKQQLRKYNVISINNLPEETDAQLKEECAEKITFCNLRRWPNNEGNDRSLSAIARTPSTSKSVAHDHLKTPV